ncbi:MAG: hypothetical protein R3F33_03915 [Planctomycetota bacterium]
MKYSTVVVLLASILTLASKSRALDEEPYCPEQCAVNSTNGGGSFPGLNLELKWTNTADGSATWIECDTCKTCEGELTITMSKAIGIGGTYGWGFNGDEPEFPTWIKSDVEVGSPGTPLVSSERHFLDCNTSKQLDVNLSDDFGHSLATSAGMTCGGC